MPLKLIASQEGPFSAAQPAQIAAAVTREEATGLARSPYAERLCFGANRRRLDGRGADSSSRALSRKLQTALARGRCVPS